jgi:competence protein ComEC
MPRRLTFARLSVFQQPLLFVAISLICGLLLAAKYQLSVRGWVFCCVASWIIASEVLWLKCGKSVVVASLMLGCLIAGGALWSINEAGVSGDRLRRLFERGELKNDDAIEIWGTLDAAPELAPDRIYLRLAVEKIATHGREAGAGGVIQVTVPFNDNESRVDYDSLALDYGTRVRLLAQLSHRHGYRNPGAPDFDALIEHRGQDATGWVKSPLLIERLGEGKRNWILSKLYRVRARALTVILRHFTQPTSGILAAALLGNRYFLSRDIAERFRTGGTFHLLVISGLHVSMIAIVALWLARHLSNSRSVQYSLVLSLMWAYALMVGAQPAIMRSVVMLSVALIGQFIFRVSAGANTLAASSIILLGWQPRDIFNPGFQLSFLTVLMIVVFTAPLYTRLKRVGEWKPSASTPYPPRVPRPVKWLAELLFWNETVFQNEMKESRIRYRLEKSQTARRLNGLRFQKAPAWIAMTIFTTTSMQVGLLPMMIAHFHRVSLVSPITNVIEGALVFALMMAGSTYLIIYSIFGGLVLKLAGAVDWLGMLTVKASEPLLGWKKASLRVPDFGEASALIFSFYFLAFFLLIIVTNEWNPFSRGDEARARLKRSAGVVITITSLLTISILCGLLIFHPFSHEYKRGWLSVTFLDVGQGDAMLISFPHGASMMLDAGGRPAYLSQNIDEGNEDVFIEDRIGIAEAAVMPYLWRRGIKRMDWIVASHGDTDHVGGFAELVRSFEIGAAMKGLDSQPGGFPGVSDQVIFPLQVIKRGDAFEIDDVRVEVISPVAAKTEPLLSDNNNSLVVKIVFGDRSFLLTGDIEKEAEARLVDSGSDLRADVLKVAHHGSKTSSTSEFLDRVKPRHAVISVADPSPYGHPHAEVVSRLSEVGARVWRTSVCGAITISTDGRDLRVETYIKCE